MSRQVLPDIPTSVACPCGWWSTGDPGFVESMALDHAARCLLTRSEPDRSANVTVLRNVPADFRCYECGALVLEGEGEQHGRAGWVHFRCIPDDPPASQEGTQ